MTKRDENPMSAANAAPRCTARSKRTGERCGGPAVSGWSVCRFTVRAAAIPQAKTIRHGSMECGRVNGSTSGSCLTSWCADAGEFEAADRRNWLKEVLGRRHRLSFHGPSAIVRRRSSPPLVPAKS